MHYYRIQKYVCMVRFSKHVHMAWWRNRLGRGMSNDGNDTVFLTQTSTVRPLLEVGLSYYHFSGGASTYPSCRNIHSMSYSNTLQRNLQTAFSPTFSYFSVFLQCTIIILHLRRWNHLCRKSATCFVFSHWKATKTLIVNLKCVKDLQLDRFSTFIIVSW